METTVISEKGKIKLPERFQKHWDLQIGDELIFKLEDDNTITITKKH